MTKEKTYTLTLTETQVREISHACDVVARLRIGQSLDALRELRTVTEDRLREDLWKLETYISETLGFAPGSSFGVGLFEDADRLFDIHQVLRNRLAWDAAIEKGLVKENEARNWPQMMTVDYDEPMKYSSEQPLPVIKKVENDS